ncbi:MAG: glycosyltransferase family 4 protein [Candidatus Diapherotrites archaeon]
MTNEKKLRILHVGNHTIPCIGGIENVIWQSAREQARQGDHVEILVFNTCTKGNILPAREEKDGVIIHRVPPKGFSFYRAPPADELMKFAQDKDIVHIHGVGAWMDALAQRKKKLSAKLILTTHGGFFHTRKRGWLKWIYSVFVLPSSWKSIDGILYVSENDKMHFCELPQEKTIILPNGIEEELIPSTIPMKKRHTFLFLGRLSRNKRVDRLIDAFVEYSAHDPKAKLLIAGQDWEGIQKELEERVLRKGGMGKIIFLGNVTEAQRKSLLKESNVFVSASEYEGFGISAIEAMANGAILCLNTIPSFSSFITQGRGFLVDYSDTKAVLGIWKEIESMTATQLSIQRKNAHAFAKTFAWKVIVKKQLEWYHSILKK